MDPRLTDVYREQSLVPIVEKSDLLYVTNNGRIHTSDWIDTPVDQNGIPDRVELVRQALGTLASSHIWTGQYDVHHTAWPGAYYRNLPGDNTNIGSNYRGSATLKVRLPRQLHNYVHKITHEPAVPSLDVMRQYSIEQDQVERLYSIVKYGSFSDSDARNALTEEEKDDLRKQYLLRKLNTMQDGVLGVMPERNALSNMEMDEVRRVLRAVARVQGFSNAKSCQRAFFDKA